MRPLKHWMLCSEKFVFILRTVNSSRGRPCLFHFGIVIIPCTSCAYLNILVLITNTRMLVKFFMFLNKSSVWFYLYLILNFESSNWREFWDTGIIHIPRKCLLLKTVNYRSKSFLFPLRRFLEKMIIIQYFEFTPNTFKTLVPIKMEELVVYAFFFPSNFLIILRPDSGWERYKIPSFIVF